MNRRPTSLIHIIAPCICLFACATTNTITVEDKTEALGTIGVVRGHFQPTMNVEISTSGKLGGAGRGAAVGATEGLLTALQANDPLAIIILAPIFTAGGAIAGGVKGAVESEPAGIALESEPIIKEAANSAVLQVLLQDQVLDDLNKLTNQTVISISDIGPTTPGEDIEYVGRIDSTVDTVLEIMMLEATSIRRGWGSEYALSLTASARLIRLNEGLEIFNNKYKFTTDLRSIQSWASDNGKPVYSAYYSGIQILSREILLDTLPTYWKLNKEIGTYCPNAELGHSDAQKNIGDLYYEGLPGLKRDYIQAYVWYSLAKSNGNLRTAPRLSDTINQLTPEELIEAKHRFETWKPGECEIKLREPNTR